MLRLITHIFVSNAGCVFGPHYEWGGEFDPQYECHGEFGPCYQWGGQFGPNRHNPIMVFKL